MNRFRVGVRDAEQTLVDSAGMLTGTRGKSQDDDSFAWFLCNALPPPQGER